MKKNFFALMAFTAATAGMLMTSCKGREEIPPVDYVVEGPDSVYQSVVADYNIIVPWEQPGTVWDWSVTGATLQTVSGDTKTATVSFQELPANDTAYITIGETTAEGLEADDQVIKVKVIAYCALDINDFIGVFNCDEAGYGVYSVNFTKDPVLANTILNDNFWEFAAPGSVVKYTLSGDFLQEVTVAHQTFIFGDDTEGWVEGSGTYDGCTGTMTVDYTLYYDAEYLVHQEFSAAKKGTFKVVGKKSAGKMR